MALPVLVQRRERAAALIDLRRGRNFSRRLATHDAGGYLGSSHARLGQPTGGSRRPRLRTAEFSGAYRDRTGDLRLAKLKRALLAVSVGFLPIRTIPVFIALSRFSEAWRGSAWRAFALVSLAKPSAATDSSSRIPTSGEGVPPRRCSCPRSPVDSPALHPISSRQRTRTDADRRRWTDAAMMRAERARAKAR